jgi:very-short-patch-repair endonuclease
MKRHGKTVASYLRNNKTRAEQIFWGIVRNRQIKNHKFLQQHPIYFDYEGRERFFVADFYCAKKNLIVEIDGSIHEKQQEYDELRTAILNLNRYAIIRFENYELSDEEYVIKKLSRHLES